MIPAVEQFGAPPSVRAVLWNYSAGFSKRPSNLTRIVTSILTHWNYFEMIQTLHIILTWHYIFQLSSGIILNFNCFLVDSTQYSWVSNQVLIDMRVVICGHCSFCLTHNSETVVVQSFFFFFFFFTFITSVIISNTTYDTMYCFLLFFTIWKYLTAYWIVTPVLYHQTPARTQPLLFIPFWLKGGDEPVPVYTRW